MDLNARIDVNCGRKDGRTDGRKTGCLYRTLLKQVRQKRGSRFARHLVPDMFVSSRTGLEIFSDTGTRFLNCK